MYKCYESNETATPFFIEQSVVDVLDNFVVDDFGVLSQVVSGDPSKHDEV